MAEQLVLAGVEKSYGTTIRTPVLKGINLRINRGEFAAIIGQSGSGKSTLLNVIGLLDRADSGDIRLDGTSVATWDDDTCARFRNRTFGFVFQFHHLLPEFTALENVLFPFRIARGTVTPEARDRARALLDRVGLSDRMNNRSRNLSGGQQQRVAIARALMNKPAVLLADEPTGNLDNDASSDILELLREINRELSTTFIIVTHDHQIAAACDRVITIADGIIKEDLQIEADVGQDWNTSSPCYCRMRNSGK